MKLPSISGVLEQMYTDQMTVHRYRQETDPDGALVVVLDSVPVLEDVPCRVSYTSKDSPSVAGDKNPVSQRLTLFCRPEIPLQSGDFVTVRRGDTEIYAGRIGKPSRYGSSLQTILQQEDNS